MTQYRDQLSIDTPEQVALQFPLAGLASRMLAAILDSMLQGAAYLLLGIIAAIASGAGRAARFAASEEKWFVGGLIVLNFLFFWGYFTLFEAFWNGQTPGKRALKIRVIKDTGRRITLFESMSRNLLRIVDSLPGFYGVGAVSILVSSENKRLGDLLAGTIVVREEATAVASSSYSTRTFTAPADMVAMPDLVTAPAAEFPMDGLTRLTLDDLVLIESFFARAPDLGTATMDRISDDMLRSLCRKMQVPVPATPGSRLCLDSIAHSLREITRYR